MAEHRGDEEGHGFDPIALTLAIWLGMIVGVTGLIRVSQDAAAQTALAQAAAGQSVAGTAKAMEPAGLFNPRLMAFGG